MFWTALPLLNNFAKKPIIIWIPTAFFNKFNIQMINDTKETPEKTSANDFNGWSISHGDYLRKDTDGYVNEKIKRRMQIIKRIALIAGISAAFILFLIILKFAANL
ncbi:MAG: hypothetical protein R6W90_05535 [Ignavibacteriaceae bacterium]